MPYKGRIRTSATVQQQARLLRRRMTPAEQILWNRLRRKQLQGLKFRRQHPLGPYIVDFYCPEYRLVVEVNGDAHCGQEGPDEARRAQLEAYGYRVVRFRNEEIVERMDWVLQEIMRLVGKDPTD